MKNFLYIVIGIVCGVLGGMGMGGGTFLVPMLVLTSLEQIKAQGINLVCFVPMALCSLFLHTKNKLVKFDKVVLLVLPGMVFSVVGSMLAHKVQSDKLKICFGIFLIILGVYQLFCKSKQQNKTWQIFQIFIRLIHICIGLQIFLSLILMAHNWWQTNKISVSGKNKWTKQNLSFLIL